MPDDKKALHLSVSASNEMKALLLDTSITTSIAKSYPDWEKIAAQVQRDISVKGDDEETLQVIKGLKRIFETALLFKTEGEHDIKAEKLSQSTRP